MVEVLCHNSIKITEESIIYIDPFKIDKEYHDADYIFFTHSHYDHFSPEDIGKVKKESTVFIVTEDIKEETQHEADDALSYIKEESSKEQEEEQKEEHTPA